MDAKLGGIIIPLGEFDLSIFLLSDELLVFLHFQSVMAGIGQQAGEGGGAGLDCRQPHHHGGHGQGSKFDISLQISFRYV